MPAPTSRPGYGSRTTLIAPAARFRAVSKASAAASSGKRWVMSRPGSSGRAARRAAATSKSLEGPLRPYMLDGTRAISLMPISRAGRTGVFPVAAQGHHRTSRSAQFYRSGQRGRRAGRFDHHVIAVGDGPGPQSACHLDLGFVPGVEGHLGATGLRRCDRQLAQRSAPHHGHPLAGRHGSPANAMKGDGQGFDQAGVGQPDTARQPGDGRFRHQTGLGQATIAAHPEHHRRAPNAQVVGPR